MSLRDSIAEIISIKFDHQIEPDDYVDEIADAILSLPEVRERMEKAAKWDEYRKTNAFEIAFRDQYKGQLDLIMKNLRVREKCSKCGQDHNSFSSACSGTGTITRPATPEEVREFIDEIYLDLSDKGYDLIITHKKFQLDKGYRLKTGAILFMEDK